MFRFTIYQPHKLASFHLVPDQVLIRVSLSRAVADTLGLESMFPPHVEVTVPVWLNNVGMPLGGFLGCWLKKMGGFWAQTKGGGYVKHDFWRCLVSIETFSSSFWGCPCTSCTSCTCIIRHISIWFCSWTYPPPRKKTAFGWDRVTTIGPSWLRNLIRHAFKSEVVQAVFGMGTGGEPWVSGSEDFPPEKEPSVGARSWSWEDDGWTFGWFLRIFIFLCFGLM